MNFVIEGRLLQDQSFVFSVMRTKYSWNGNIHLITDYEFLFFLNDLHVPLKYFIVTLIE